DREALHRGNSVYLVDRVLPMLPPRLSNGICSLRPDEDRLTKAAFIEFDKNGRVRATQFAEAVIRSKARLTYKQAFAMLSGRDGPPGRPGVGGAGSVSQPPSVAHPAVAPYRAPGGAPERDAARAHELAERLHVAWELASLLRKNRFAHGSLDLDFPEVKVL